MKLFLRYLVVVLLVGCNEVNLLANCGDLIVDAPVETCDDGGQTSGDGCSELCELEFCGDGTFNNGGSEQCDDGAANSDSAPDACRLDCSLPFCGDGVADSGAGEECDLAGSNSDAPNADCRTSCQPRICGDGILDDATEQCDDGGANSDAAPNACRTSCVVAFCGDGVKDTGENCDSGALNGQLGQCPLGCLFP